MNRIPRIVLAGEILPAFLSPDGVPLDAANTFERVFVGAESNTAVGLARLGLSATFIGCLGDDALGRAALRFLRGEGVDTSHMRVGTGPTGMLARSASSSGRLEVVYGRRGSAGSELAPGDISEDVVATAAAVHCTGITPMLSSSANAAALRLFDLAGRHGVPRSFDPNLRLRLAPLPAWRLVLAPFLAQAEITLTGADELRELTGISDIDESVAAIWHRRSRLVVVKDGAAGARAWDGTTWHTAAATPVVATDPVGAGDGFNAGFLVGWLLDQAIESSLRAGTTVGAAVVQSRGDTAGLPVVLRDRAVGDIDR